jgi:hypothetical protein
MRVFQVMGNRRLHNIECIHNHDMPESERLKVTALNLFHPTAFPLFEKASFTYYDAVSGGEGKGEEGLNFGHWNLFRIWKFGFGCLTF